MDRYQFQKAKPVWLDTEEKSYNQFAGFYTECFVNEQTSLHLAVAARTYYRLYINGERKSSGPARCAHGYCRVDEICFEASSCIQIALEIAAFDKPEKYCNDNTLEFGLVCAELTDMDGKVLAATGVDSEWRGIRLTYRKADVELMSHSRGIMEFYQMNEHSMDWLAGKGSFEKPAEVSDVPVFLKRHAPYASYREILLRPLSQIMDWAGDGQSEPGYVMLLSRYFNPSWYAELPQENFYLQTLLSGKDVAFSGKCRREGRKTVITFGEHPVSLLYSLPASELGFIQVEISNEKECTLDVVSADHRHKTGMVKANTYVSHFELEAGDYQLVTFEPKLVRYLKLIIRSEGEVTVYTPKLLDDTYPDDLTGSFECSDGDLNRIYEGARRTLRLNTLDIFMDCPERERGGWLCDSYFSAQAAWQLFGNLSVEKDFLENFLLTDGRRYQNGFFPEVYPSSKKDDSVGIQNWSFWLMTELLDYYERSGDRAFLDKTKDRVSLFVDGMLALRGESGLLEGLTSQFVDWSLSNKKAAVGPINIPNNCLAVRMLEGLAVAYQEPEWEKAAQEMRTIIEKMDLAIPPFMDRGDSAEYQNGILARGDLATEGGIALELWSGFHQDDWNYAERFVTTMGTCPRYRSNPNIGKANLFIGLMIRFDVLARMGEIPTLVKELRDIYLPELRDGSGTFFENYQAFSGCHGFNGMAGVFLTSYVLGLGRPEQRTKTIRINPHPGELKWASGTEKTEDGFVYMNWGADDRERRLDIMLELPEGWSTDYRFDTDLDGWKITVNGKEYM